MAEANSTSNQITKTHQGRLGELEDKVWAAHAFVVAARSMVDRAEDLSPGEEISSAWYLLRDVAGKLQDIALGLADELLEHSESIIVNESKETSHG